MDWPEACRILGVPESATETQIKEQYLYKAQLLHPDKNQDKPESIRKKAEAELSLVNQAYSMVNNPNNNPYRIPPKLAVEPMGIRFQDIEIGERKETTFTVRSIGGPYTSIWIENKPAPWLTVTGVKSITSERLPLEVALECMGTGESGRQYTCDLPIKLQNENTQAVDQAAIRVELNIKPKPATAAIERGREECRSKKSFSTKAFLVNIMVFAVVGILAVYCINIFLKLDQAVLSIGLICYTAIGFGISFNQGVTIGSKGGNNKIKRK
jgi:hypothetical protein